MSSRLYHVLHFVDEQTPNRLGTDTSAPFEIHYGGEDAGKTAYYMLRWVNKRGQTGPWSATISAVIQG